MPISLTQPELILCIAVIAVIVLLFFKKLKQTIFLIIFALIIYGLFKWSLFSELINSIGDFIKATFNRI